MLLTVTAVEGVQWRDPPLLAVVFIQVLIYPPPPHPISAMTESVARYSPYAFVLSPSFFPLCCGCSEICWKMSAQCTGLYLLAHWECDVTEGGGTKTREIGGKISAQCIPACVLYCTCWPTGNVTSLKVRLRRRGKMAGKSVPSVYLHVYCTVPAGPLGMWRHSRWGAKTREIGGKISVQCSVHLSGLCTTAGPREKWRHSGWWCKDEGNWRENQCAVYLHVWCVLYCTVPAGPLGMWRHSRWGFEDEGKWRPALSPVATWTGQLKKAKKSE